MGADEMKTVVNALNELGESYADLLNSLKGTIREVKTAKKLWNNGENSWLIKIGLALLAFPDPTISDLVGGLLIAAGMVQKGIRRCALHVEDIPKTFQEVLKELQAAGENINHKLF
ncbi:MAG: hypothetical protein RMJ15_06015 [Nitrososphaerota archaeon]|nr:hypothetical protein [Candidatus Bathyarchaeota archaeon]MDW8023272.1 hypothetical protein [Nitrososphaerota archaeon]